MQRHYEINNPPTCTKSLTVKMNNNTLRLKQRTEVFFNGEEIKLPKLLANDISVLISSSLWLTG